MNNFTVIKGIFNVCFLHFYPSTNRCLSLRGIGKPPWSLWLNLCLKFTARLWVLTDNCMSGVERWGSHSKIMFNTIIPCNLLCYLLSTFLLLNLGLPLQRGWILFSFTFLIIPLGHYGVLCGGRPVTKKISVESILNSGCNTTQCWKSQWVWTLSEGTVAIVTTLSQQLRKEWYGVSIFR